MHERPIDFPDSLIASVIKENYDLTVTRITFLDLGADAWAWTYRLSTKYNSYFLKIRKNAISTPSLLVPHYLREQGINNVVAPLANITKKLWSEVHGYGLILYPFIEGNTGKYQPMSPSHWTAFGASLRKIHEISVPTHLARLMKCETFVAYGIRGVLDLYDKISKNNSDDAIFQELAKYWQKHKDVIDSIADKADYLGKKLSKREHKFVLCHADIHTNNLIINSDGLSIVDWDETVLSLKERDLMFVLGGGISRALVSPEGESLFIQGYGDLEVDSLAITYYLHAWAINDISEFGMQVLSRPDLGKACREEALEDFMSLFMPGNIVTQALDSDSRLLKGSRINNL